MPFGSNVIGQPFNPTIRRGNPELMAQAGKESRKREYLSKVSKAMSGVGGRLENMPNSELQKKLADLKKREAELLEKVQSYTPVKTEAAPTELKTPVNPAGVNLFGDKSSYSAGRF